MAYIYGNLQFKVSYEWKNCANGMLPIGLPVIAGYDINGSPVFIGRAIHDNYTIPGRVVPQHKCIYVPYYGKEYCHSNYQVLVNSGDSTYGWTPAIKDQLPSGAIQGGQEEDGVKLYIGRAHHNNRLVVGKVHPKHLILYAGFEGNEVSITSYEVLVCNTIGY